MDGYSASQSTLAVHHAYPKGTWVVFEGGVFGRGWRLKTEEPLGIVGGSVRGPKAYFDTCSVRMMDAMCVSFVLYFVSHI